MFVNLFTSISTVWDILWCKTIIFEVKTLILHQITEVKASVVGILSGIEYPSDILSRYRGGSRIWSGGGAPCRDRPKTAILGPQFCRILVLGPHFWWSGGARAPGGPPWIRPCGKYLKLLQHIFTVKEQGSTFSKTSKLL